MYGDGGLMEGRAISDLEGTVVASQWAPRRDRGNWEVATVPIWGSEVPWRLAPQVLGGIGIKVLRGAWYARACTCVTRIDSLRTIVRV